MPIDVFKYQIVLYTLRRGRGGGRIIFVKNNLLTIVVLSLKIAFKALKISILKQRISTLLRFKGCKENLFKTDITNPSGDSTGQANNDSHNHRHIN
jgi:hypothetical protein